MSARRMQGLVARILLAGIGVLVWGLWCLGTSGGDPAEVTCAGQPMTTGHECGNYRHGFRTYEQIVADNRDNYAWRQAHGPSITGVGAIVVLGSALFLVLQGSVEGGATTASRPTAPTRATADGTAPAETNWWSEGERP